MAHAVQRTARKDYPDQGIKKGETYWFAEVKTGPRSSMTIRSKTPIPRSRLTSSEFLSQAYRLSDSIYEATTVGDLETIKEEFEALRDDTQEKLDNMPEGLQQGDTGQLMQERIDQCESLIDELDSAISDAQEAVDEAKEAIDEEEVKAKEDDAEKKGENVDEEDPEAEAVRAAVESHISSAF